MTIGDPFLNNSSNSQPILTTNLTPNSSFSNNNNNNINMNMNNNNNNSGNFNSSPIPTIYQKKFSSNPNSNLNSPLSKSRCKRRSSESEDSLKKTRFSSPNDISNNNNNNHNIPIENLNLQNINLEEYPKFNHPEGGIIQFTPIGNIRTFITDNNIVKRIIEEKSTFDLNKTECGIDGYKLYLGSVSMDSSPSNEIETYMRVGYSNNHDHHDHHDHSHSHNTISNHYHNPAGCSGGCCSNFDYDCDSDLEDDEDYMS